MLMYLCRSQITKFVYLLGDCGTPSDIANGYVTIRTTEEALMADYSCNGGYVLTGNTSITCNSDGRWPATTNKCG